MNRWACVHACGHAYPISVQTTMREQAACQQSTAEAIEVQNAAHRLQTVHASVQTKCARAYARAHAVQHVCVCACMRTVAVLCENVQPVSVTLSARPMARAPPPERHPETGTPEPSTVL